MKLKTQLFLASSLAATLIVAACGLDLYVYLYPVETVTLASITDPINAKFVFSTNDYDNEPTTEFKGFEIFYRIYNNSDTMNSDRVAIEDYNDKNPTLVGYWIQNSKLYRRMRYQNDSVPLIPGTGTLDRPVELRLIDYTSGYPKTFTVASVLQNEVYRSVDDSPLYETFDFININSDDSDVTYTTTSDDIVTWYVQAFVFTYGYDSSFSAIYSEATYLSAVYIPE